MVKKIISFLVVWFFPSLAVSWLVWMGNHYGPKAPTTSASVAVMPNTTAPTCSPIEKPGPVRTLNGFRIVPECNLKVTGIILAQKSYFSGPMAELSPADVLIGWGAAAGPGSLKDYNIVANGREFSWAPKSGSIQGERSLKAQTMTLHLVPRTQSVATALRYSGPGSLVTMVGQKAIAHPLSGGRSVEVLVLDHVSSQ